MKGGAWREHLWWWLLPLVLVVVNLVGYGWFQVAYSGQARNIDELIEKRASYLSQLGTAMARQDASLERVRRNQREVEIFYSETLATSQERLTDILREVRNLAETAGLSPTAINYPEDELAKYGLERRGVNFGVRGSYLALRRFVNLLEMSDSFLTLEEISLSGGANDPQLRIRLRLSTLFSTREPDSTPQEAAL